ncbi:MAG: hypothetical protein JW748_05125 [Anaerolineales bacterium]|nr:hypothetical protein [Anaerolineales bacterium]
MNPRAPLDPRLLEALSAYLDGRLEDTGKAALEDRLSREEDLRRHLAELRAVKESLRALPALSPPRPLTLTPAQAGAPVRPSGWFSPRRMTLGAALAAMAFALVLSADLVSRGAMPGAAAPLMVENFTAPAMLQSADQAAPEGSASPLTVPPPAPTASGPQEKYGGGEGETPGLAPPPGEPDTDGRGESSGADAASERSGIGRGSDDPPAPQPLVLPDFRMLAPWLEVLLGSAAVVLAALAVWSRRRK